jgi:hypothetical protein
MQIQSNIYPNRFSTSNDIEKCKTIMKDMPFFQAFSPDGFHQTLYGKLDRQKSKACIIFNHEDMENVDLSHIVQCIKSLKSKISLVVTNDIYFREHCDFLTQEKVENVIMLVPGASNAVIVGQPTHIKAKLTIESSAFYKHVDKFMTYISSLNVDSTYYEMSPTYTELITVHSASSSVSIEFNMYVNIQTRPDEAIHVLKAHIQQYLNEHNAQYEMQHTVIVNGFYNSDITCRYYLMQAFEKSLRSFVHCIADEVCIKSQFLISPRIIGLSYLDQDLFTALSAIAMYADR